LTPGSASGEHRQDESAQLYARAWVDPSAGTLIEVFNHLRTLQYILYDYIPRHVAQKLPTPGEVHFAWQEGALMFTDLAGFTRLMEANAPRGRAGATVLLDLLNSYFSAMIETISYSGGSLLEFTGDALLAVFQGSDYPEAAGRAVRAGLRMQRAMERFAELMLDGEQFSLKMRIGVHTGRFLAADIGTPKRTEHVLLGLDVHRAKLAESAGQVDRVNLTDAAYEQVSDVFRFEPGQPGCQLVVDDFSNGELGEYEVVAPGRRLSTPLLLDRSVEGLLLTIQDSLDVVERLASYLPSPVLNLLVENAAKRQIPPDMPRTTVIFVSLLGVPEAINEARSAAEVEGIVRRFSGVFAMINAAVEARGGMLKKVTYHLAGSDVVIYFGAPNAHSNDTRRAASAALEIREIVTTAEVPGLETRRVPVACQIGLSCGPTFAGEIGEARGRREYNVLGPVVNTAARLMNQAEPNQIVISQGVYASLGEAFTCDPLGTVILKGTAGPSPIYGLLCEK
jgi:class 3 adenylate cyclase